MKCILKYLVIELILIVVQINIISCNVENTKIPSVTDNSYDFEYIKYDDEPLLFNAFNGFAEIKYFDGCIYFFNGNSSGRQDNHSTLYRFNERTGNLTMVCTDPLCKHNTPECPFYAMEFLFYIYDNKIYYPRKYFLNDDLKITGFFEDFVSFNINDSKLKQYIIYTEDSPTVKHCSELYVNKYRYYYTLRENKETKEMYLAICRLNLDNGAIDILKEDNSSNKNAKTSMSLDNMFLFAIDQRIYFTDGKKIYSTDYDMNYRQDIVNGIFIYSEIFTDGEFIYWGESEDPDNINLQTLYRTKIDGSGDKYALGIKTEDWQLTKKYIYYLNPQETVIGKNKIVQRPGSEIVLNTNEIRRAALDGSSNELVFSLIRDDTNFEIYSYTCVGNYIYVAYHTYTDSNKDGAFDDSEYYQSTDEKTYSILRIDVTTGDTYYIHCGTEDS